MSAKPPYIPKPNLPRVEFAPHRTINPPFRPSRKIISKEELPGGSITYHLGAYLTPESPANQASSEFIQVSATDIDNHVSYEELERFEHADFESHVASEISRNDQYQRRQTLQLLRGSFKKDGRGRPRKRVGLDAPLMTRQRRVFNYANSSYDKESGGTTSDSSSADDEGMC